MPAIACVNDARVMSMFEGFDELWFFNSFPLCPLPAELTIVAPIDLEEDLPNGLFEWMTTAGAQLGLGGGYGTNYATLSLELSLGFEFASI